MDNGHYSLDCLSGKNVRQTLSLLCPSLRFEVINLEANKSSLSPNYCFALAVVYSTALYRQQNQVQVIKPKSSLLFFLFLIRRQGSSYRVMCQQPPFCNRTTKLSAQLKHTIPTWNNHLFPQDHFTWVGSFFCVKIAPINKSSWICDTNFKSFCNKSAWSYLLKNVLNSQTFWIDDLSCGWFHD